MTFWLLSDKTPPTIFQDALKTSVMVLKIFSLTTMSIPSPTSHQSQHDRDAIGGVVQSLVPLGVLFLPVSPLYHGRFPDSTAMKDYVMAGLNN